MKQVVIFIVGLFILSYMMEIEVKAKQKNAETAVKINVPSQDSTVSKN